MSSQSSPVLDPSEALVYLGLGANLGDRDAAIERALARLGRVPGVRVLRVSTLRDTAPVGGPEGQPDYRNGVAELACSLPPHALLAICQQCERDAGRESTRVRNAPRPLDLDILAFGRQRIDSARLRVPHPRWRERAFVTEPLRELGVDTSVWPDERAPFIVAAPAECAERVRDWRAGGCSIGIVPTMGALHDGHGSLIERARRENDRVIVTVFVNPLQFDVAADLAAYPRDLEHDAQMCRELGADLVFAPTVAAIYGAGFASRIATGDEARGLEGGVREGHFEGVATIVAKLLILGGADRAYFGEKDAQQLAVVRRMVADLGIPTEIVGCAIWREPDGLAMSSRNARLGPLDRVAARALSQALFAARDAYDAGERSVRALLTLARGELAREPRLTIDYVEFRRELDFAPLPAQQDSSLCADDAVRLLVAARVDGDSVCATRLIDNIALGMSRRPESGAAVRSIPGAES